MKSKNTNRPLQWFCRELEKMDREFDEELHRLHCPNFATSLLVAMEVFCQHVRKLFRSTQRELKRQGRSLWRK